MNIYTYIYDDDDISYDEDDNEYITRLMLIYICI